MGIASDDGHACNTHFFTAALAATTSARVYRYEFRHSRDYPGGTHCGELPHVFYDETAACGVGPFTDEEDALALGMASSWAAFAASGHPGNSNLPVDWPPYDVG